MADERRPLPPMRSIAGDEPALDPALVDAAEAVADGTWSPADGVADAAELQIIARVKQAHAAAARREPAGEDDIVDTSASIGEAMSRALPGGARPELSAARRWGPLFILEPVGSGSFGEVYRAWDPALDREVALKLVHVGAGTDTATAVVREGQLLASVRHANVISVYGAAQIDGEVGIWMEFVRGRTLEQIVREDGPLSAPEATVIGESLCGALAAVHQAGLLHRDIKAANVMRAAGGRIVLLDFGAGTAIAAAGGGRRLAGTPLYMAPEMLGGGPPTARSDIYSLGIMLFYLVTESYPVYGRTVAELRESHRAGKRLLLTDVRSDLPAAFSRAVEFATTANVDLRPASAGELSRALAGLDSGVPFRVVALYAGIAIAAATAGLWLLGLLTTLAFNTALGRMGGFAAEPWAAYWLWGARSLLAPLFFIAATVLLFRAATVAVRLVMPFVAAAPPLQRIASCTRAWVLRAVPLEARTPRAWSEALVLANAALLAVLFWSFADVFLATISSVSASDPATFLPFQPDNLDQRNLFRLAFSIGILACLWSWQWIEHRCRGAGQSIPLSCRIGAVMVTALFVFFITVPYRIGWQNAAERYEFSGQRCYALGTTTAELLLYCPDTPAPRVRTVAADDGRLRRANVIESFFTPRPSMGSGGK